jgi:glycosyltransferase involved in cell wall biosynthesis
MGEVLELLRELPETRYFEILVVDNASTDGTPELMRQYEGQPRLRYVRNERNIGMVGSWRRAVFELLRGDWFMILSDDDYLIRPDYLQQAASLITVEPALQLVYADGYVLYEGSGEMALLDLPFSGVVDGADVFASRGRVKPQDFTLCNVLFRRELAVHLGAFSNPNNLSCDTELFLLSCLHGKVGVVKEPVSVYRIHPNNLLKSTATDPRLNIGALNALIMPYEFAINLGLEKTAKAFRESSRLDYVLKSTLLKTLCQNYGLYFEAKTDISNRAPRVVNGVLNTLNFKVMEFICLIFPQMYVIYRFGKKAASNSSKIIFDITRTLR